MQSPLLVLLVFVTATSLVRLPSQEPSRDELRARHEAKLAEPFVANAGWVLDLAAAKARAAETGKPIFAYFTRSYAPCPPCRKLEVTVLETPEFAAFVRESAVPFLHVATHLAGRAGDDLLADYGQSGFPTLLILNANGKCVAIPAERTVASFRAAIAEARAHAADAHDATAERDPRQAAEAYLRDRRLGNYADPAKDRVAFLAHGGALTEDERAAVARGIANKELTHAVARLEELGLARGDLDLSAPEFEHALLEALAARDALGGWPPGAASNRALIALLAWADRRRDPVLFERWLAQLRDARQGLGGNAEILGFFEARLADLWRGRRDGELLPAFFASRKPVGHR